MAKAELISFAEFARRQKISPQMVSKADKQGVFNGALVDIPGRKKPLLKYKLAVRFYNSRLDPNFRKALQTPQKKSKKKKGGNGKPPGRSGGQEKPGGQSFVSARADVEKYRAAELKLKHEINRGLWLKKSDIADKAFKAARLARDSFLNIPARVAALVSAESDQNRCYKIIHDEIKDVLNEFVRQLKQMAK